MSTENQNSPGNSLLDEIIANSRAEANAQITQNVNQNTTPGGVPPNGEFPSEQPPKNPQDKHAREPINIATALKFIGVLAFVVFVFLGIFLSYVVFNPDQATFFVNVFGILPSDVAELLKKLIGVTFGFIAFILSITFIVSMFRAIWTPKEQKRRKTLFMILSIITGLVTFGFLGLWAVVYGKINSTNFANLGGHILFFDNDLYIHDETREHSGLMRTDGIIGPITIRYNFAENALRTERTTGGKITNYSFNFDGASCDKTSGSNATDKENFIICTFDAARNYELSGKYTVQNPLGEIQTVDIAMKNVEIKGIIDIKKDTNKDGNVIQTFDASPIRRLGIPTWKITDFQTRETQENKESLISAFVTNKVEILDLFVGDKYERSFVIKESKNEIPAGDINILQDSSDETKYIFTFNSPEIKESDIIKIEWFLNDNLQICRDYRKEKCVHTLTTFGEYNITAKIQTIGNKNFVFNKSLKISAPLLLERSLKILNTKGKILNPKETFDVVTKKFVVKDILPPEKLIFDARDVIPSHQGYTLNSENITWTISNGQTVETRKWARLEFNVTQSVRYEIMAEYEFHKITKTGLDDDIRVAKEHILLDLERKNITPSLKIIKSSDYVPTRVTVDASQSKSESSELMKFEFDFGEGRPVTIGDAVQTYTYHTAGEKTITVTVIDINNERETIKETIVLKDTPLNVDFQASLATGLAGKPVDFEAKNTTWDVEEYLWNFGDNTPIEYWYTTEHTFSKAGIYTVTLTVRYMNWTEKLTQKTFKVVDSLE